MSIVQRGPSSLERADDAGMPAMIVNLNGLILEVNAAAATLCARSAEQLRGTPLSTYAVDAEQTVETLVSEALVQNVSRAALTVHSFPGRNTPLPVTATRIEPGGDGEAAAVLVVFTDAEPAPHLATNLPPARAEARLRVAQKVAGVGVWEWNPSTDELLVSDAFSALIGVAPGTALTLTDALAAMPDEDRVTVRQRVDDALAGEQADFSLEYRVQGPDSVRWLQAKCEVTRDARDGGLRVVGATRDVTAQVAAGDELRRAENFWYAAIDSLSAHVAIVDEHGEIIAVNQAWRRFGEENGAVSDGRGTNYFEACDAKASDARRAAEGLRQVLTGELDEFSLEYSCHAPDAPRWFVMRVTPYQKGPRRWAVVAHEDATARRSERAQVLLQAALLDEVDLSVHATDAQRRIITWNDGAKRLFGWSANEAIGEATDELLLPADASVPAEVRRSVEAGGWAGQLTLLRKDGSTFPAYVRARRVKLLAGESPLIVVVTLDLTERLRAERELRAARDHLRAVTDGMGEGVYSVDEQGRVTYMNAAAVDLLGWTLEDVEGRVMHELAHSRRPDGSPLSVEDCPITQAQRAGETIWVDDDIFLRPDGSELPVAYTASPLAGAGGSEGCVVVFRDITERKEQARRLELQIEKLAMVNRVRDALAADRLVLYAQPIIELATGAEVQRELLLRMREPDGAITGPGAFLPVAEEFGLITQIDRWVVDRAAEIAARGFGVELNVSAASIGDPLLVPHITDAIRRTGADPTRMVFEITETALVGDEDEGRRFVQTLHELGCKVALDDFGTGYGGFTYLKQMPIDYLKIDIEFVRDLTVDAASLNVVQAIVSLARGLGLRTVAEGVEDAASLALLRELGVDYAQGYHICRPAPFEPALSHHASGKGSK